MSNALEVVMAYANAFEETYADDDWSRLAPYFAEDAVYEVVGGPLACRLQGREAIFAGLKKSLDTLDRRCSDRSIKLTDGPDVEDTPAGGTVSMGWHASYQYRDAPREGFPGRSVATVNDGVITELRDEYDDAEMETFVAWMAQYGEGLSGSYV